MDLCSFVFSLTIIHESTICDTHESVKNVMADVMAVRKNGDMSLSVSLSFLVDSICDCCVFVMDPSRLSVIDDGSTSSFSWTFDGTGTEGWDVVAISDNFATVILNFDVRNDEYKLLMVCSSNMINTTACSDTQIHSKICIIVRDMLREHSDQSC